MTENDRDIRDHLHQEELEGLALEAGRALPERSSAHAAECLRCARELQDLKRLHSALLALSPLLPGPGFTDRVMRRVSLPVPWRIRVVSAAREHWAATAAAFAALVGTVGVGASLAARYPELTPVTVAGFIVERATALAWGGVMAVGRLVYGSGILTAAQGVAEQMTLATALLAAATLTLVGLGALRIMLTLMNMTPGGQLATRG